MDPSGDYESSWIEASLLRKNNPLALISPAENHSLLHLVPEEEQKVWLDPEVILTHWIEYHLRKSDPSFTVKNFTTDWTVCIYFFLIHRLFIYLFLRFYRTASNMQHYLVNYSQVIQHKKF